MIRLLLFVVLAIFCDMCLTQRLCGIPRPIQPPAIKYSIPAKPNVNVRRPIIDNYDTIQTRVLNKLQDNPVKDDCGCFSSEIISKLIDALVVSTTMRNNGRNEGDLLNVAVGDTNILGVYV